MTITEGVLEAHILQWEARLNPGYRGRWPSRLFRHETLENAVELLKSGRILSRRDAAGLMRRDVAPEEIINLNQVAHDYARLYFRPKTPTQYRIEGIRRADEIWNDRHAPVLYMLVLKSRAILTRGDVCFSRGNMQIPGTPVLHTNEDFATLDFRKIYHEGGYPPEDADIKVWRCAEVLCLSPLMLNDCLEAVVCRSDAERKTLLDSLGGDAIGWAPLIRTVTQPGYFNAEYAFVESVDLNAGGVSVKFHPRRKLPMETWVQLSLQPLDMLIGSIDYARQELDLRKLWNFNYNMVPGRYRVTIYVDDELAYRSVLEYAEIPF
jgi:hypothetical protein